MKRPLTPEEEKLWEQVRRTAKPLTSRDVEMRREKDVEKKKAEVKIRKKEINPLPTSPHPHIPKKASYAGIDRNTAERFRKGKYDIDGTLDLHGFTRDNAWTALNRFLHSHYERGSRCLLVITGKGLILREELPRWLGDEALHKMILTFDSAKQKHGGSGAFYILLRRKRSHKE